MKMKSLLAIALTFSAISTFAAEVVIPQSVLDLHTKACPEFSSERGQWMQKEAYKLPGTEYNKEGSTLYVLGCEMYAYNSMEKAYIVDSYETTQVAVVEVLADGSLTATTSLMGAGYDPETTTLGTFQKGRGMGDCGSSATYLFNAREGRFVLTEARLKDSCDGEESDWPIIYKK